jgi:hypothetical protein
MQTPSKSLEKLRREATRAELLGRTILELLDAEAEREGGMACAAYDVAPLMVGHLRAVRKLVGDAAGPKAKPAKKSA